MANKKKNKFICPICSQAVSDNDEGLQCDGRCDSWYHKQCAGVSDEVYNNLGPKDKWLCISCEPTMQRKEKANNVSNNRKNSNSTDTDPETCPDVQHKLGKFSSATKIDLRKLDPGMQEFGRTLNQMTSVLTELQKAITYQSAQYDNFYDQMKKMQTDSEDAKKRLTHLEESNKMITQENAYLRQKVNKIDQQMLSKEIKIQGISQTPDESLTDIVVELCATMKYALPQENILLARRLPEPIMKTIATARSHQKRPQPILVKLVNEKIAKEILAAKRACPKMNGQQIGREDRPIFVNERLTPTTKRLFWLAQQTKNLGYRFSWVKDGQVMVRKDEHSALIKIDREEDVPTKKVGPPPTRRFSTSPRKKSEGNNSDGETYLST